MIFSLLRGEKIDQWVKQKQLLVFSTGKTQYFAYRKQQMHTNLGCTQPWLSYLNEKKERKNYSHLFVIHSDISVLGRRVRLRKIARTVAKTFSDSLLFFFFYKKVETFTVHTSDQSMVSQVSGQKKIERLRGIFKSSDFPP